MGASCSGCLKSPARALRIAIANAREFEVDGELWGLLEFADGPNDGEVCSASWGGKKRE